MKLDFKQDKESKKILKILADWITKYFGVKCKTPAALCSTCEIWAVYELLRLHLP